MARPSPLPNPDPTAEPERLTTLWTIPNLLCMVRLVGAFVLPVLAVADKPYVFLAWFLLLSITDWLDGKLAVLLNQRSVFGARLDSWADATLYAAVLASTLWLRGEELAGLAGWIVTAVLSYALSTAAGFWKFGRWPSYHTRSAKTCWLLAVAAVVCLLGDWARWPFQVALIAVTLANLESLLITWVLPQWQTDVPSLWHARRIAKQLAPN